MKYQSVSQDLSKFIFPIICQALYKFDIYVTANDKFRIKNKCDFLLAKRFAKCKFFKFFVKKDN